MGEMVWFSMRKPTTIQNSNIQDSNKTLKDMFLDKLQKSPERLLVALNTLDKFLDRNRNSVIEYNTEIFNMINISVLYSITE